MIQTGFKYFAPEFVTFGEDSFSTSIGNTIDIKIEDKVIGQGEVVKAEVVDNGKAVEITIETDCLEFLHDGQPMRFSVGP